MEESFPVRIKAYGAVVARWAMAHKVKATLACVGLFIVYELLTIPWFSVANLKDENPVESALMRQRADEAEDAGKELVIRQSWIPFSRIPRHAVNAVVLAEDGTFWEHGGFDWYEFQQSLKKNWEKKRVVRGASTITQQLAKNLYLSTSRDPLRKLKEWVITYLLESRLEKRRILEIYLNVIEWGPGVFGIDAAARTYFKRSASALSYDQALRLAAVIPSPLKHRPTDNTRWVQFRRNVVAARMAGRKYIDDADEPDEEPDEQPAGVITSPAPAQVPVEEAEPADDPRQVDSVAIERGDSNDVQRREQVD